MPTLYANEYINDGKNVQHPVAQNTPPLKNTPSIIPLGLKYPPPYKVYASGEGDISLQKDRHPRKKHPPRNSLIINILMRIFNASAYSSFFCDNKICLNPYTFERMCTRKPLLPLGLHIHCTTVFCLFQIWHIASVQNRHHITSNAIAKILLCIP